MARFREDLAGKNPGNDGNGVRRAMSKRGHFRCVCVRILFGIGVVCVSIWPNRPAKSKNYVLAKVNNFR